MHAVAAKSLKDSPRRELTGHDFALVQGQLARRPHEVFEFFDVSAISLIQPEADRVHTSDAPYTSVSHKHAEPVSYLGSQEVERVLIEGVYSVWTNRTALDSSFSQTIAQATTAQVELGTDSGVAKARFIQSPSFIPDVFGNRIPSVVHPPIIAQLAKEV